MFSSNRFATPVHPKIRVSDAKTSNPSIFSLRESCCDIEENFCLLKNKETISSKAIIFWSENGFAFTKPGKHLIEINLLWQAGGFFLGARETAEIWVDYPVTAAENEIACLLLSTEVGKFAATQGAYSGKDVLSLLEKATQKQKAHPACKTLNDFLK